jgi:hypothetical protein
MKSIAGWYGTPAHDAKSEFSRPTQRTGAVLPAAPAHRPPHRTRAHHQPNRARLDECYGAFYSSALHPLVKRVNAYLVRWLRKKHKRLHGYKRAKRCWDAMTHRDPGMFARWQLNRAAW